MGQGEVVERLRPGLGCVLLLGDWARWYFSMYGRWAGSISPYARQCGGCRGVAVPPWYCAPMSEEAGVSCYCSVGLSSPTQGVERKTVGVNTRFLFYAFVVPSFFSRSDPTVPRTARIGWGYGKSWAIFDLEMVKVLPGVDFC